MRSGSDEHNEERAGDAALAGILCRQSGGREPATVPVGDPRRALALAGGDMTEPERFGGLRVRPEAAADRDDVFALVAAAFETEGEAVLVDRLREAATPLVSLVAVDGRPRGARERLVGHILFSPVTLHPAADEDDATAGERSPGNAPRVMGLAPMAVAPAFQRRGVGTRLVRAGLDACRAQGAQAVVVLGHPDYYPRFGFRPAEELALGCEYEAPPGAFMAQELVPGSLAVRASEAAAGGLRIARYHQAFAEL
jgi:putative acetyltransferase